MADPITITISSGLVLERLFSYLILPRLNGKKEQGNDNPPQSSGDKNPDYWKAEFRGALDEKLEQRVLPILEKQTSILESLARTSEGIAADLNRRRRR